MLGILFLHICGYWTQGISAAWLCWSTLAVAAFPYRQCLGRARLNLSWIQRSKYRSSCQTPHVSSGMKANRIFTRLFFLLVCSFDIWKMYVCVKVGHPCVWKRQGSMCLFSKRTELHLSDMSVDVCHMHEWTTEWIPVLFPGHLPVLGIVAVGSGLALIIFGISSFLIYRWVLHPADACCLLRVK